LGKRGHNEGSIYKRGDGRWAATVTLGYDGNKRRRKTYYGVTRKEVQEQLTAALRSIQQGASISTNDRQTVVQYFGSWLETLKPRVRFSTWERCEQYVRLYIVPTLGRIPLSKLAPQNIEQLYAAKLNEGYSTTTVAHLHTVVHRALDAAVRLGLVQRNVSDLVDPPSIRRTEITPLTPEQARTLLETASDRFTALYVVAITTGMRLGELLALKWPDIDLEAGTAQVRATLQRAEKGVALYQPKTKRSRRNIALTAIAIDALRQHHLQQNEERSVLGSQWQDNDLVFPNVYGGPMLKSNLLFHSFKPLLRRAGLPSIRFHDLRHTAATFMLVQGVHPKIVSEMLGHASISITLDLYSHVLPNMQKDAVVRMDDLLGGTTLHTSTYRNGF